MVFYNNDGCKSVSFLMLLISIFLVTAADAGGKTSPVEDGTLFFTHTKSHQFSWFIFFLGGLLVMLRDGVFLIVLRG